MKNKSHTISNLFKVNIFIMQFHNKIYFYTSILTFYWFFSSYVTIRFVSKLCINYIIGILTFLQVGVCIQLLSLYVIVCHDQKNLFV